MDAHAREGDAAVAGMRDIYGAYAGEIIDGVRRWKEDDYVLFQICGKLCCGFVLVAEYGLEEDRYLIKQHIEGGGTTVVSVAGCDILIY
jgi:hypothetical protein